MQVADVHLTIKSFRSGYLCASTKHISPRPSLVFLVRAFQVNVNNQNGASGGPMGGTKGGSRSPPKSSQSAAQKSQPSTNSNNNRKRTASNSVVNTVNNG